MKTSLLILCACFAIAASRDSTRSSLDALKSKEFLFMPNNGAVSYSMVRCGDSTKLIFVGTNQPRGVLIEKDEGCHILPINNLISGIHDDRVNDQMNRINNFAVQESTCKTFVVVVPAYPSDITDFLVECVPDM